MQEVESKPITLTCFCIRNAKLKEEKKIRWKLRATGKMYKFRGMKRKGKGKFFVSAERNGKGKEIFLFPRKEMEKERKFFCFRGKKWKGKGKFFPSAEAEGSGMENLFPFLTLILNIKSVQSKVKVV